MSFATSPISRLEIPRLKVSRLEEKFTELKESFGNFDYRIPNEKMNKRNIEELKKFFNEVPVPGDFLTVGAERSFFNLFCASDKCERIIVKDVDWKIKAYLDFVILLLRISDSIEEFQTYINEPDSETFLKNHSANIIKKLENIKEEYIPIKMKDYYSKNLKLLASLYIWDKNESWHKDECKNKDFELVDYTKDVTLFKKLQEFARKGNFITVVDDIRNPFDDEIKKEIKIVAMEISNVPDYIKSMYPKDLIEGGIFIWNNGSSINNNNKDISHLSAKFSTLTSEELNELELKSKLWGQSLDMYIIFFNLFRFPQNLLNELNTAKDIDFLFPYFLKSKTLLNNFRFLCNNFLFKTKNGEIINFCSFDFEIDKFDWKRLAIPEEETEKQKFFEKINCFAKFLSLPSLEEFKSEEIPNNSQIETLA